MTDTPLTPGPAADALVAEAMGWTNVRESKHPECLGRFIGHDVSGNIGFVPAYTTSWAGLGAMVEWMVAKGIGVTLHSPMDCDELDDCPRYDTWACFPSRNGKYGFPTQGDTPMLAVAEALLVAVAASTEGEAT